MDKLTKDELRYLADLVSGTCQPYFWTVKARVALVKKLQKELQK